MRRTVVMLFSILSLAAGPADAVFINGKVWVGTGKLGAEAVAVFGGRILAVGRNEEIKALAHGGTTVVDLGGKRLVPGFNDAHCHVLGSGLRLSQVALKDAQDETELGRRLVEFDRQLKRDRWMIGGEWDHDRALNGELPTAALLDKYVKNRPVFLRRYDGHMAVANSTALKLAGITSATADPAGGVIYRKNGSKEPTGLLRDNAMDLVEKHVPPPSDDEIIDGVKKALAEAARFGVTSLQDMDGSDGETRQKLFRYYQRLDEINALTARVDLRWPLAEWERLANLGVRANFGSPKLRIGGVKGFIDGSLGSSTAKMSQPYVNEPGTDGVYVTPRDTLLKWIIAADSANLSVCVHAIGDQANSDLLDIYQSAAQQAKVKRDRRFRIEHAQHLKPGDYVRFGRLDVIASMQPYHAIDDGRWAEGRIGKELCKSSYAFRSLHDAGARIAFGSDWSVAPINPLEGIDAAVNRRTLDGRHPNGWFPEQCLSVEEALTAYTLNSAYAQHRDHELGTIEVGKWADFAVLSNDILDPAQKKNIEKTKVVMTVLAGQIVHEMRER